MNKTGHNHHMRRTVLQIVLLMILLLMVGYLAHQRVHALLNKSLESKVAHQVANLSAIAQERFERELVSLRLAAAYLEPYTTAERTKFFEVRARDLHEGVSIGLLLLDGSALYGEALTAQDFPLLPQARRGVDVVDYNPRKGLIFAVPIHHNGNVQAVTYRLYANTLLVDLFALADHAGKSRLSIQDRSGNSIVLYKDFGMTDRRFFNEPAIKEAYAVMRRRLETQRADAIFAEIPTGRFFLFSANVPRTNCCLVGYATWEVVAGSIAHIHYLLLRVGAMVLLAFGMICISLIVLHSKAETSARLASEKNFADQANVAKSRFLATMSHEIRTPLNVITGMNEMILREEHNPLLRSYAETSYRACNSLLLLTNDILDFSRIESGKLEITLAPYRFANLLRDVVAVIQPQLEKKGLAWELSVDKDLPHTLRGDVGRVRQILLNLLTNAVKYTRKGRVSLRVTCEALEPMTVLLRCTVSDTGIGIREEDKEKLFKGFARFDLEKNRNIEGTGLGLAITAALVSSMGGSITIESVYGMGSTFTVTLPQSLVDAVALDGREDLPQTRPTLCAGHVARFTAPDVRLLLVDDNELNLLVLTSLLRDTKMRMDTCQSGEEALSLLAKQRYDAVLLDQMMPGMDGVETLHRARTLPEAADIPFVVCTADVTAGAREQLLAEGFAAYIGKPVETEHLERVLETLLPPEKLRRTPKPAVAPASVPAAAAPEEAAQAVEATQEPVLDTTLGMRYSGGDRLLYRKLAQTFCAFHASKAHDLDTTFAQEDWKNYSVHAHALKSSALSLGGKACSAAAKALEAAARRMLDSTVSAEEKAEMRAYILGHHATVLHLYDELVQTLSQEIVDSGNGEKI